jgi:hypothetical protein
MRRATVALLASLLVAGCHRSGTWDEDPKNVERAWGIRLPAEVKLRHSWYWRSAHFTREEAYYFQFGWHQQFFESMIAENQMRRSAASRLQELRDYSCFERPAWFIPGNFSEYEAWVGPAPTNGVLFRHKTTNELFLAACQM